MKGVVVLMIAAALLIDFCVAHFVYHDNRCMIAQCRVMK